MNVSKNKRKILDLFVKALKEKFGDRIDEIILFGSVARGEDRENSDIDVLIRCKGWYQT